MIALLKEAEEIKKYNPTINKALKNKEYPYSISYRMNIDGYITFEISKSDQIKGTFVAEFHSRVAAKSYLEHFIQTHNLCKVVSGLQKSGSACFEYGLGQCNGACIKLEEPNNYNNRIINVFNENENTFPASNFIIIDKGRNKKESSAVLVTDSNYYGYTYIENDQINLSLKEYKKMIPKIEYDPDFNRIIKRYISNGKLKIIKFNE